MVVRPPSSRSPTYRPQAQIVYVSLWTDFAIPILDFNIILTGYDQQQFNVRDILFHGRLPVTLQEAHSEAERARDSGPVSTKSSLSPPVAELAEPAATTALGDRCSSSLQGYPGRYTQPISGAVLNLFEPWLRTSQDQLVLESEDCKDPLNHPTSPLQPHWYNQRTGADPTWFYLTADVVDRCDREFPDSVNYWRPFDGDPAGLARYDNVLTGDVIWISGGSSTAAPAVHLEADRDLAAVTATSNADAPVSFYHRYSILNGNPTDGREPLPTAWGMR